MKKSSKANSFYTSPGSGSQGKCGNMNKTYVSHGSGGQKAVGAKRNKFAKSVVNSTDTTGA